MASNASNTSSVLLYDDVEMLNEEGISTDGPTHKIFKGKFKFWPSDPFPEEPVKTGICLLSQVSASQVQKMEPTVRIELTTRALRKRCSAD